MKKTSPPKWAAGAIFLIFTFLCIYFAPRIADIPTQYSIDQFQPLNSQILSIDDRIRDIFHLNKQLPLITELKIKDKGTWLSQARLKYLADMTKDLKKIEGVHNAVSIATVDTSVPDQGSFYIGSLRELSLSKQERKNVLQNPLLTPNFLSKDGKNASILIELKRLSFSQQEETLKNIHNFLNEKSKHLESQVGGAAAITIAMSNLISSEVVLCTLISLFVSICFFFLMFRNPSVLIASSIIVVYSNILGLGMLWLFNLKLTMLTSTIPTLVTLTVVSISLQIFSRISEFRNKVIERHRPLLVFRVIKSIAGSCFLASLTTAIGFMTLLTSDTPIMKSYGTAVSLAIMVASLSCLILLSCLLIWLPIPQKRQLILPQPRILNYFYASKKPFLISIVAVSIIMLFFGNFLNWSVLLFDDLPSSEKAVQATYAIEKSFGGSLPLEIAIKTNEENFWKKTKNIQKLHELKNTFSTHPGVGSFVTVSDFLRQTGSERRLPASDRAVSETLFIYSMAQENPLNNFLSPNNSTARIALRLFDLPSQQNEALITAIVKKAHSLFPKATILKGGTAATVHSLNENLSKELIHGAFYALFVIFLMMIVIFRSFRWALVALIPNLLTPICLVGILGVTQTPIKPALAIVFAISLGIAFDNTIYILTKLRKLLAHKKNTAVLPILSLMREEFVPCLISSTAAMAGFSVFLFSNFSINKTFGTFMILGVAISLVGDLVLLPVLLHFAPGLLLKPLNTGKILENVRNLAMKPNYQRYIIFLLIVTSMVLISNPLFAAPNATDILKKIAKDNATASEEAKIRMTIKEPDGSSKDRTMVIKKKQGSEQMALVRLLSPNDLKGIGLLSVYKGSNENQWLYLPSEKRSRRIVGSNSKGRFLDSEINYEDLRLATYENFNNKVLKDPSSKNKNILIIESTAKDDDASAYGKIKTWVDTKLSRIVKAEYYTPEGKLLKVMTFSKYKKYKNVWRARMISVKNVQKNRSTTLKLEKFSTKNLDSDEFTVSALEEG